MKKETVDRSSWQKIML